MSFEININVGSDAQSSTITASGKVRDLISAEERETFGVDDFALTRAIKNMRGEAPDEVHLRDNSLFDQYGWTKTHRVMEVLSAEILSIDLQPVALATHQYENLRDNLPSSHTATLSYAALVSAATNWSAGSKLTLEQKFTYKIGLPSNNIGGETRIGLETTYGEGASKTLTSTITTADAVTLVVEPGTRATATLSASKGTLKAKVSYRAYLEGDVYYDYHTPFEGHHHWAGPIDEIMAAGDISNEVVCSETIEVGFYADTKVIVSDDQGNAERQIAPAFLTMD